MLPQETIDRIDKDAQVYDMYASAVSPYIAYRRGATAEAEKAHALITFIEKFISRTEGFLYEEGINVLKSYNDGK